MSFVKGALPLYFAMNSQLQQHLRGKQVYSNIRNNLKYNQLYIYNTDTHTHDK
jgi:hypothetical protein